MTLVAWITSAGQRFVLSDARTYITTDTSLPYYYPSFTADQIQTKLANYDKVIQQELILARDDVASQNGLHVVLSGSLYGYVSFLDNEFTIRRDQLKDTFSYLQKGQTQESPRNNSLFYANAFSDSSSDDSDDEDGLSQPYQALSKFSAPHQVITTELLALYQQNHKTLNVMTSKERVNFETNVLIRMIVSVFADDQHQFLELLASQDKEDLNTPLHCAVKSNLPAEVFAPLLEAVKDTPNLDDFALKRDCDGRTIFHYLSTKIAGFYQEIFGRGILQIGLTTLDFLGCTPLHIISQDNYPHKLADLTLICNLAREVLATPNSPRMRPYCATEKVQNRYYQDSEILNKLFGQANDGKNPLHYICQQTTEILVQIEIIKLFRATLGEAHYHNLLLAKDSKGNLPSQYALHNLTLLKCLLTDLEPKLQQEILLTINENDENVLFSAAKKASAEVFVYVIELLGHSNLYKCRHAFPMIATAAKNNPKIGGIIYIDTIKKYNALFDCVNYFLENKANYHPRYETGYIERLNDFRGCIQAVRNDLTHLPVLNPNFENSGWLLTRIDQYCDNRKHIKMMDAQKEIKACTDYFQTTEQDAQAKAVIASIFNFSTPRLTPLKIGVGAAIAPPELHLPPAVRFN